MYQTDGDSIKVRSRYPGSKGIHTFLILLFQTCYFPGVFVRGIIAMNPYTEIGLNLGLWVGTLAWGSPTDSKIAVASPWRLLRDPNGLHLDRGNAWVVIEESKRNPLPTNLFGVMNLLQALVSSGNSANAAASILPFYAFHQDRTRDPSRFTEY